MQQTQEFLLENSRRLDNHGLAVLEFTVTKRRNLMTLLETVNLLGEEHEISKSLRDAGSGGTRCHRQPIRSGGRFRLVRRGQHWPVKSEHRRREDHQPVSYTHLTLPTNREV